MEPNRRSEPDKWAKGDDVSKRLVQCPGCWAAAMARKDVDWECECGELMTVVDLRAIKDSVHRYNQTQHSGSGVFVCEPDKGAF